MDWKGEDHGTGGHLFYMKIRILSAHSLALLWINAQVSTHRSYVLAEQAEKGPALRSVSLAYVIMYSGSSILVS